MPEETWVQFLKVSSDEIARIRPDGTGERVLYPNPGAYPSPSRDGEWLAFLKPDETGEFDLWVRKPDGTVQNLTNTKRTPEYAPNWSWDGQKIAFVRPTPDGNEDIFIINRDGTNEKRLTNNPASDHAPIWHPDNRTVVFASNRPAPGNFELYKVDINNPEPQGGSVTRLTNDPASDFPGAISSDGNWLFWHSDRPGNWDIFKMAWANPEAQGGPVYNLTNTQDKNEFVFNFGFISGDTLVFKEETGGQLSIHLMSAVDGSNRRPLRSDAAYPHFVIPPVGFQVAGFSPSEALNYGVVDATVFGNGFQAGASVRLERNGQVINGTDVVVQSPTEIKAKFDVTDKPEGRWDVVVRNPDGQEAKLQGGFSLLDATPQVAAVNPNEVIASAVQNKDTTLTVTGDRFLANAQVRLERNGQQILAKSVTVKSRAELDAVFDFTGQPLGAYDVVVKNPNNKEGRKTQGFNLKQSSPSIAFIDPNEVIAAITRQITMQIQGEQFFTGARVSLKKGTEQINATEVTVESQTKIVAKFDLTEKPLGKYDVVVENNDGGKATLTEAFNLRQSSPSISSIDPTQIIAAVTKVVTLKIFGGNFFAGARARLERNSVQVEGTNVQVVSEFEIRATFDLTEKPLGKYDVVVDNNDGGKVTLTEAFNLRQSGPSIVFISPPDAENFGIVELQISGSEFLPNAQVKLRREGETDIPASQVQFVSQTELKATFDLTAKKPGEWQLVVQNPDGGEVQHPFSLLPVSPIIHRLTPDTIVVTGEDVSLEIQGEKFLPGSQVVVSVYGQQIVATVQEQTDRRILALFNTAHVDSLGFWTLSVTHPFANVAVTGINLIAPHHIHLSLFGWAFFRNRLASTFWIHVSNSGGVPTGAAMIFISGISPGIDYKLYDPDGELVAEGTTEENFVIWHIGKEIPPYSTRTWILYLTVDLDKTPEYESPNGVNPPVVHALTGRWARKVLHAGGEEFVRIYNEIAQQLGERLLTEEDKQKVLQVLDEFLESARNGSRKFPARKRDLDAIPEDALGSAEKVLLEWLKARSNFFNASLLVFNHIDKTPRLNPVSKGAAKAIKREFGAEVRQNFQTAREQDQAIGQGLGAGGKLPVLRRFDPNIKIGLFGVNGFITPNETLRYEVHFENDPQKATEPAPEVQVTDVLDANLDLDTFAFEEVNFSGRRFSVSGQTFNLSIPHSYTFRLGEQTFNLNMTVTIEGSLDRATRTVRVRFQGSDPNNFDLGFLPPNRTPPEGEGSFRFSVKPKADAPSGAQIKNKATIVFPPETPMDTNEHVLTLDKEPPNVRIVTLPTEQALSSFPIRWEGSDDASGIEELQIWVSDNGSPFRLLDILGVGGRAIPQEIPFKGKFGHEYRFYAVGVDKVGNRSRHPDQPQATTRAGTPPRISAGLKMVSLPVISEINDPKQVFGFDGDKWAWYDPATKQYVRYPATPAFTLQVGKGFWARFGQEVIPNVRGDLPDDTRPFEIPVKKGWNIIGNPWLVELNWDANAIQVRINGQTKALKDASSIVEPYAWRWDGSAYQLVIDPSLLTGVDNKLPKWEGAWVFAWQDATLLIPLPQGNRLGQMAKKASEGWVAKLVAQMGTERGQGLFGMNATTPLRIASPPSPPEGASGSVQVFFVDDKGQLVMADFRRKGAAKQEWTVLVKFGARDRGRGMGQEEVTLTFDGIGYAPKELSLWLVDTVTGKRLYLRTQQAYQFVPQSGEQERRLKVIAEIGNERPLRVLGLKATPLRGRGMSIQFALTKAAQTQVELLTLTGRRIAVVESGQNRGVGLHQIFWQGRGTGEVSLPSGMPCLVRLLATDEEGRQVQATTVVR
jgi:dipeptidyl aminopeptidase/acylaminoacyl peptidase